MIKDKYKKENLEKVVVNSQTYSDVARKIGITTKGGCSFKAIKKYIKLYNLDTSHFLNRSEFNIFNSKKIGRTRPLNEILVENSTYSNTVNLKKRLYKEFLKPRECELCGQDEEWRGKKMSLILDHKNGVNTDNRIENLRIVCPNCNATLPTTNRGSDVVREQKKKAKEKLENKKLHFKKQRKVERPSYEVLIHDIKILGYVGTGKKYSVSDNAIRKWKKFYEKYENK